MLKFGTGVLIAAFMAVGANSVAAQQVDRNDLSQPTPGEIAMAAECRDTYKRMRALEKLLSKNRDAGHVLDIKLKKSGKKLDELKNIFEKKSAKSQQSEEAYQAALSAKETYEKAAVDHNAIIDEQDKLAKQRSALSDEFFIVNPNYVTKCSGTIFKALSVILTCKDEKSDWCDLLK